MFSFFSSNRPTGLIRSSSRDVRPSVCLLLLMCPFHLLDFEAYFAPTSQSQMSKILAIRNPWGKVLERSGLRIGSGLKLPRNFFFFFADLALQNVVETTLPNGLSGFWVFLDHPPMASVL